MRWLVCLLLLQVHSLFAVDSKGFWVLAEPEPPFINTDELGRPNGYPVEMVQGILTQAGIKQDILTAPWPRLLKEGNEKDRVLIFTLARTVEREDKFHWIAPITKTRFGVFALNKPAYSIKHTKDLNQLGIIGSIKGDFREELLNKHNINTLLKGTWDESLGDFLSGRTNGLFFSGIGLHIFCEKGSLDCSNANLVYNHSELTSYLVLSKTGTPKEEVEGLQSATKNYLASESYQRLKHKWLSRYRENLSIPLKFENNVLVLGEY